MSAPNSALLQPEHVEDLERTLLKALDENEHVHNALQISLHNTRRLKACEVENARLRNEVEKWRDIYALSCSAIEGIGKALGMDGQGLLEDPSSAVLAVKAQSDRAEKAERERDKLRMQLAAIARLEGA